MKNWLTDGNRQRMPDLGARELSVLEVLWATDCADARSIHAELPGRGVALSTVQSTLERLYRKGLVLRRKQGRAYRYRAVLSREQLIGNVIRDLARDLAGGRSAPMVSGFIEYMSEAGGELPDEIVRAMREAGEDHD